MFKDVINETGTIHAAIRGIGRTIGVAQIFFDQREPGVEDLANFRWVFLETFYSLW